MPRAPQFNETQILSATGRLIARHGPSGATIGAIARALGAPTGSIYHRFDSRDGLLAEVWLGAATAFCLLRAAGRPGATGGRARGCAVYGAAGSQAAK